MNLMFFVNRYMLFAQGMIDLRFNLRYTNAAEIPYSNKIYTGEK